VSLIQLPSTFPKRPWYLLLVGLLLLQFALRAHDVTILPGYADESHHIRRAEVAWDFTKDPYASYLPGKLLLYYYLGLFETERVYALLISRLAVALFSLIGGAALYAVGRKLFRHDVGIMALFAYVVMPFTVFYDRMALADSMASSLLILAVWVMLLWREKPTLRMGALTGLVLILPPLAKLTAVGVIAVPFLLVWIYDRKRWRRYVPSAMVMLGIFGLFWVGMFLPTLKGEAGDDTERIVLINDNLLNIHEPEQGFIANLIDNTEEAFIQVGILYWNPALVLTVLCWFFLLGRHTPIAILLVGLLVLAWLPTIVLGSFPSSRYLEIGVPFLILMLVGGLYAFAAQFDEPERRATIERAIMMGFILYSLSWCLSFYRQAIINPGDLELPEEARWRFIQSVTAGYGQEEAALWLKNEGSLDTYGILGSCHLMRLFLDPSVNLTCATLEPGRILAPATIERMRQDVEDRGEMYVLLERSLAANFDDLPLEWTFERNFPRPHDGVLIELWRVAPAGEDVTYALPAVPID
jgi:hypothetical protein